jgi:hypothetical protein
MSVSLYVNFSSSVVLDKIKKKKKKIFPIWFLKRFLKIFSNTNICKKKVFPNVALGTMDFLVNLSFSGRVVLEKKILKWPRLFL